jgi:DNA invertase Pin-like site-specific DNA recombinase
LSQEPINIQERLLNAKKIATYHRVSKEKQEHTRQEEIISQYLSNIGNVDTINFKDTISATKKSFLKREDFKELLEEAQENNIDAVIVSDFDRLTRQPREHEALRKLFQKLDIPVIIASKNYLYNSDDIIRNIIEAGLSKLETDNMSTRIRYSLLEKMKNGKWRGNKVPFGFMLEEEKGKKEKSEKKLIPIESEIEIVKDIFNWYSTSGTFNSIAKQLNESGRIPNNRKKFKWTPNKVKYIITNPIYMGEYAYHRFSQDGGYNFKERNQWKVAEDTDLVTSPPISKEQWERCWQKYLKLKSSAPRYANTSFYFSGILKCMCPACNGALFHTKDQRSKGRGSRWYISKCGIKISTVKLDEEFEKYRQWLLSQSDRLFEEDVNQLLLNQLETLQIAKTDKDVMFTEKLELRDKIDAELKKISKKIDIGEKEFIESGNDLWIALIVSKYQLDEQISELEKELKKLTFTIKKLEKIINEKAGKTLGPVLLLEKESKDEKKDKDKDEKRERDAEMRSIVLMTVKECNYVIDEKGNGKIEFVFNLPFKNYLQM